jgi:hypothetical protein
MMIFSAFEQHVSLLDLGCLMNWFKLFVRDLVRTLMATDFVAKILI